MSYAIAAAGTGGHVYPGLAIAEALVAAGIDRDDVHFVGGARMEAEAVPAAGFPFHAFDLRGLRRSLAPSNLLLPWVVARATWSMRRLFRAADVRVVLGMGGYVTVPAAVAGRLAGAAVAVAEQNAYAGLANRIGARIGEASFVSFPATVGMVDAEWVGNPVRKALSHPATAERRREGAAAFGIDPDTPTLGVFGGSLGAGVLNRAVETLFTDEPNPEFSVLHLTGEAHIERVSDLAMGNPRWVARGYTDRMDLFYAASDVVLCRAGGSIFEVAAAGRPAVIVPGRFAAGGHQHANAAYFEEAGAAVVVEEDDVDGIVATVRGLMGDPARRATMAAATAAIARPDAAVRIAERLRGMHG